MEMPGCAPEKYALYEQKQPPNIAYNRAALQMIIGHLGMAMHGLFVDMPTHFDANIDL